MKTLTYLWFWGKIVSFVKTTKDKLINTITKLGGIMRRFMRRMRKKSLVGIVRAWRWAYPRITRRVKNNQRLVFQSTLAILGVIVLRLWIRSIESKVLGGAKEIPFMSLFKWGGLALAVIIAIWFLYKMAKNSSSSSISNLSNWRDELKVVFGYIVLNIAFGFVWPEVYVKAMKEHTWPFIGTHIFFLASMIMLAGSPSQAGRIGSFMKTAGLIAVLLLTLRLFGVSLEPWNWSTPSWGSDKKPSDRNLPYAGVVSTAGSAVRLPSPAWDYYAGPEKTVVMSAFPADTVMWAIAACESRYRQFREDGTVLRGGVNPRDIGLFQINDSVHAVLIKSLMEEDSLLYNISTVDGNIEVAKILRNRDEYQPWNFSSFCWRDQLDRSPRATTKAPVSLASTVSTRRAVYGASLEIRDSVVTIPAGGWSGPVEVPFPYYLSDFTASRKDSLFMMSPSGKVYGFGPSQRARLEYEAGPWRFGTSDSASAEMEVAVSRRR